MKTYFSCVLILLTAAASAFAQEISARTRDAMRLKLQYAQGILEGMATENYFLIATNSSKLKALAQSADWQIRTTADYQRFTSDFILQTEGLGRAARKESIDAATVFYFQLTVSCVQCHRAIRGNMTAASLRIKPPEVTKAD